MVIQPFTAKTASIIRGIESDSLNNRSFNNDLQSLRSSRMSSSWVSTFLFLDLSSRILQRFSMGFKSGDCDGHSNTRVQLFINHTLFLCASDHYPAGISMPRYRNRPRLRAASPLWGCYGTVSVVCWVGMTARSVLHTGEYMRARATISLISRTRVHPIFCRRLYLEYNQTCNKLPPPFSPPNFVVASFQMTTTPLKPLLLGKIRISSVWIGNVATTDGCYVR